MKNIALVFGWLSLALMQAVQAHPNDAQANALLQKSNRQFFTENKGQIHDQYYKPRPDVLFSGSANGLFYHLKKDGLHYQLLRVESWKKEDYKKHQLPEEQKNVPDKISIYRVDVNWLNASTTSKVIRENELPGYTNYYNVPENTEPALFVKSYESIRYQNIYNGIDLHFYSNEGNLEYDFIVQPYADYQQIKVQIKGAELKVSPNKELILKTPFGEIVEGALKVYQGSKQIQAEWVVQDNKVSFHIPKYDPSKPLRIDPPVRLWATYYGSAEPDYGYDVACDYHKRSWLVGQTYSTANIATSGAHQTLLAGDADAFVAAFAEWGTRRWATYLGGNKADRATACAATAEGHLVVGGFAESVSGIATPNAFQSVHGDAGTFADGFVSLFDTAGVLLWSTYAGGSWRDEVSDLALDDTLNIYITGHTQSTDNIATNWTHDGDYNGSQDVFMMKFDISGNRKWGTYFGDANDDSPTGIALRNEKIALTGITNSTAAIATSGAHQSALQGPRDLFVALFSDNGILNWATYYGGSLSEDGGGVALDSSGNVYVSGTTFSSNGISTTGSYKPNFGGGTVDALLVKFSPQGQRLWGTYYGGQGNDEALFCQLDPFGDIYFGGTTGSSAFIASSDGFKPFKGNPNFPALNDGFLVKFRANGTRIWATYYGGGDHESAYGLATDTAGNIFLGGYTYSSDWIASDYFAHQKLLGGSVDAFLVRFNNNDIPLPDTTSISAVWEDEAGSQFIVFPNPAQDRIFIQANAEFNFAVKIFDMQGKLLYTGLSGTNGWTEIHTNTWSKGIYYIHIQGESFSENKKIILQH